MKNYIHILLIIIAISFSYNSFAQVPQKMSYQSVIRNTEGNLVVNASIGIQISILKDTPTGQAVYVETMTNTTNENGLLSIEIGGGTPVTGSFSQIDWSTGTYFVKTETDPTGGTNYSIVGTGQLLSVPYALYADSSSQQGKTTILLTDDITDEEAAAQIVREVGPNTENVIISNTTQLTNVNLSQIKNLLTLSVTNNEQLASINFSNLISVYKDFLVENNLQLTNVNFNSLANLSPNNKIINNAIQSLIFPQISIFKFGEFLITGNEQLTSLAFPILIKNKGFINIESYQLTTIDLSQLQNANEFYITSNSIGTINLSTLINSKNLVFSTQNLGSLNLESFVTGEIQVYSNEIQTINLPLFTSGSLQIGCQQLTSLNIPLFTTCDNFSFFSNNMTSFTVNSITSIKTLNLLQCPNLVTIDFPSLTSISQTNINNNSNLTTITFPLLSQVLPNIDASSGSLNFRGNKFSTATVDYLLNKIANSSPPTTGKTITLDEQNPPAPPTSQGLVDKQTLIDAGNSVITD
jgi:hypothetical protein